MLTFLRSHIAKISQKQWPACLVLQFRAKKPTYCQLLTSFRRSNRMFISNNASNKIQIKFPPSLLGYSIFNFPPHPYYFNPLSIGNQRVTETVFSIVQEFLKWSNHFGLKARFCFPKCRNGKIVFLGWFGLLGIDWRSSFLVRYVVQWAVQCCFLLSRLILDSYLRKRVLKLLHFY